MKMGQKQSAKCDSWGDCKECPLAKVFKLCRSKASNLIMLTVMEIVTGRWMFLAVGASPVLLFRETIHDNKLLFFLVVASGRRATAEWRGQISSPERRPARPHWDLRPTSRGIRQDGSRSGGDQEVSHTSMFPFYSHTHTHLFWLFLFSPPESLSSCSLAPANSFSVCPQWSEWITAEMSRSFTVSLCL